MKPSDSAISCKMPGEPMSQRDSGYTRIERDAYQTPEWVTLALVPHIPKRVNAILEPAAGEGKMARALENAGYKVFATDIDRGEDFLEYPAVDDWPGNLAIITN